MELKKTEFKILYALQKSTCRSQRELAKKARIALGAANKEFRKLVQNGLVDESFCLTEEGLNSLAPYKVNNAIIMAAGLSSRFAPLSYEKPKGLLEVKGEILIERQIQQLLEAGITDITVVVGYMKEAFFYLEDKYGVNIVVNSEYATRNNNSTLFLVKEKLANTYICSSDDYFVENVFEPYVFEAYYSAEFFSGKTEEYCLTVGANDRIVGVSVGGADSWGMIGHVYFDRAFSEKFIEFLVADYDLPETKDKLWEDIYIDHIRDLYMVIKRYEAGTIFEFDSLNELRAFDPGFIVNVDSRILDNICSVLECIRTEIKNIIPIKTGLTNLSFRFEVNEVPYVYRHPGVGTDEIINRESETFSQNIARELGIDGTFVYEDPKQGWKISRFIPDCVPFDYHNESHIKRGLELVRRLHKSGVSSKWHFDVYQEAKKIVSLLKARNYPLPSDFESISDSVKSLYLNTQEEKIESCLCHNDFYDPNFLVRDDLMYLIDWEYSAMSDYASDLGTFICCSDYSIEEAQDVIEEYFMRAPSPEELRHCLAYVAISSYYWFVWAIYKEASGNPVGEWLFLWYRSVKSYSSYAKKLYE